MSRIFSSKVKLNRAIRFFSSLDTLSPHFYRHRRGLVFARRAGRFLKGSRKKRKYRLRKFLNRVLFFKKQRWARKVGLLRKSFKSLKSPIMIKSYKIKKIRGVKRLPGKRKGPPTLSAFLFCKVQRKFKLTSLSVQKLKKKLLGPRQISHRPRKYPVTGKILKKRLFFRRKRLLKKINKNLRKKKRNPVKLPNKWRRYRFFKLKVKFRRVVKDLKSPIRRPGKILSLSRMWFALPRHRRRRRPRFKRFKRGQQVLEQKKISRNRKRKKFRPQRALHRKFYAFRKWKWRFPRWSYKWRNFSRFKKGSFLWKELSKWSLLNFFPNRITRRPKQPKRVRPPIRTKKRKAIAYLRSKGEGTEARRALSIFSDRNQVVLAYKKIHKDFYGKVFADLIKNYYAKARKKDSRILNWQNSLLDFLENRLDVILLRSRLVPHIEMSRWLIRKGYVFCNGNQILNPSSKVSPLVFINVAHQSFIDMFRYWLLRDRYHRHLFRCRGFRFDSIYQHPNSELFAMVLKKRDWRSVPRVDRLDFYQLNRLLLSNL